ncbi:uncharacterized protein LOC62_03G004221 [Vanrija pseudolonga]|uniref:Uncharacterized protein n=1 Tax=Vanrija pseudolonga TaxID=143232 RepID=A0AAF1BK66_9TREE|nr:hypothetical protein LOC62_03G004221 [Vanrija pseudolonga]
MLGMLSMFYAAQYHQILSQQAAVTPGTPVPPPYTLQQAQTLFCALTPTQQKQVQTNFIARQRLAQQAQQAQQQAQQAGAAPQAAGQPPTAGAAPAQPAPAQPSATASAASTAPATPTPAPPKADKPKADKAAAKSAASAAAAPSGSAPTPPAAKKNAPVRPRPPKEPKKARIDAPEKEKGKEKGKGKEKDKDKDKGKEPEAEKKEEKEKTKATKDKDADKSKDVQAVTEAARMAAAARDDTPDVEGLATTADPRRPRKEEGGFRGSMRGEIARLMYAAGDVVDPDVDSVDYIEDMVIEFLSDLCRPVAPIRANVNAARLAVPLSADTVRHRLATHSHLRKYLERWDHMAYMSVELQQSKRVAQPSHMDLISSVGKQFLGLDGEQESGIGVKRRAAAADINADGDVVKRRGRPPKNPEERKKPGPKKGWKKNLDPNALPKKRAPQGRPYKKKDRPQIASVAPSPKKQP